MLHLSSCIKHGHSQPSRHDGHAPERHRELGQSRTLMEGGDTNVLASFSVAVELVIPIEVRLTGKHRDAVVTTLLPRREGTYNRETVLANSANHPMDQLVEAVLRHRGRMAVLELVQTWGVPWDYEEGLWLELVLEESSTPANRIAYDLDNILKLVQDGLTGRFAPFANDRDIRELSVSQARIPARGERSLSGVVRIMSVNVHRRVVGGEVMFGVVAPLSMAAYSLCASLGVRVIDSPHLLMRELRIRQPSVMWRYSSPNHTQTQQTGKEVTDEG